jgi:hypothetical protein
MISSHKICAILCVFWSVIAYTIGHLKNGPGTHQHMSVTTLGEGQVHPNYLKWSLDWDGVKKGIHCWSTTRHNGILWAVKSKLHDIAMHPLPPLMA